MICEVRNTPWISLKKIYRYLSIYLHNTCIKMHREKDIYNFFFRQISPCIISPWYVKCVIKKIYSKIIQYLSIYPHKTWFKCIAKGVYNFYSRHICPYIISPWISLKNLITIKYFYKSIKSTKCLFSTSQISYPSCSICIFLLFSGTSFHQIH